MELILESCRVCFREQNKNESSQAPAAPEVLLLSGDRIFEARSFSLYRKRAIRSDELCLIQQNGAACSGELPLIMFRQKVFN